METNEPSVDFQPKYFTHYFRFEKTNRDKWFELKSPNIKDDFSFISCRIKAITWVELIQPKLSVFQMNEDNSNRVVIRMPLPDNEEKYWIGRFKYSGGASILLVESNNRSLIEMFFSGVIKNDSMTLLKMLQSGVLKDDIKHFRK